MAAIELGTRMVKAALGKATQETALTAGHEAGDAVAGMAADHVNFDRYANNHTSLFGGGYSTGQDKDVVDAWKSKLGPVTGTVVGSLLDAPSRLLEALFGNIS